MRLHFLALFVVVVVAVAHVAPHSAEADQGQQAEQRTRVKRLKPSADTDVVLNEALLATDGAGRTRLLLGAELLGDEKFRAVTIVDRAAGTLALVTLSGDHRRDANRVSQAYKRRGVDVDEQQLFESLRTQKISSTNRKQSSVGVRDDHP